MDEDLITDLQGQISALESQVSQYLQSGHQSLEISSSLTTNKRVGLQRIGIDHATSTTYARAKLVEESNWASAPIQVSNSQTADVRSQFAMEEIASLMLTMDLEGRREPSFMLPPAGKGKPKQSQLSQGSARVWLDPDTDKGSTTHVETRKALTDSFMKQFNVFHRFVEEIDTQSIILPHAGITKPDEEFRNNALLSIGAHLSNRLDSLELSSLFAGYAEEMVLQCLKQHSSDLVCQGISLLAWRELILGNDSMAYNYIGELVHQVCHV